MHASDPDPRRPDPRPAVRREDALWLLVSVVLFGWFGFFATDWAHERLLDGTLLPMVVLFKWTLRAAAIGFAAALLLRLLGRRESDLLCGAVGLVSAIVFAIVAVWGVSTGLDPGLHPVLLLVFAIFNGWVSWDALRPFVARGGA